MRKFSQLILLNCYCDVMRIPLLFSYWAAGSSRFSFSNWCWRASCDNYSHLKTRFSDYRKNRWKWRVQYYCKKDLLTHSSCVLSYTFKGIYFLLDLLWIFIQPKLTSSILWALTKIYCISKRHMTFSNGFHRSNALGVGALYSSQNKMKTCRQK